MSNRGGAFEAGAEIEVPDLSVAPVQRAVEDREMIVIGPDPLNLAGGLVFDPVRATVLGETWEEKAGEDVDGGGEAREEPEAAEETEGAFE